MVQQVIEKCNEYNLIHSGSSMPHPVSVKKMASWELPDTSDSIVSKPAENSLLTKESGQMLDSIKAIGTKRQQPDFPSSHQPLANKAVNGHLVYVRRKLDTERGKKNISNTAYSLSSSLFPRKFDNEKEIKEEARVQQDKTEESSEILAISEPDPNGSGVNAITHGPVDLQTSTNQDSEVPVAPQRPSNGDSTASLDPQIFQKSYSPADSQRATNQECKALIDLQRPSNQELDAPVDSQHPSKQELNPPFDHQRSLQELNTPVDPQRPSIQEPNVPVDSQRVSIHELNAPVDPQRLNIEELDTPVDPQRSSIQESNPQRLSRQESNPQRPSMDASVDPRSLSNQETIAPVDSQKPNNQESKASVDPETLRPTNQGWKERYLKLQMYLKNCDQSSQEDYKSMLRSLTAAGRSKHALDLEKRALNLLLEEGKELHRMQVLNVIGDQVAPPSARASPALQRTETFPSPKSPFLRNDY